MLYSVSFISETANGLTKKLDAHDGIKETLKHKKENVKVLVGEIIKVYKKFLRKSCDRDDLIIFP
jgi:hypothetical protein